MWEAFEVARFFNDRARHDRREPERLRGARFQTVQGAIHAVDDSAIDFRARVEAIRVQGVTKPWCE